MDKKSLNQLLTVLFMLLAVAAIVIYFVSPNKTLFYGIGITAIIIRVIQYVMRFFGRKKRRRKPLDLLD